MRFYIKTSLLLILFLGFSSCSKIRDLKKAPDISPLQEGFKTSAAIGYCASLAVMYFQEDQLPGNVDFNPGFNKAYSKSGTMYVRVDPNYPLPFNNQVSDIIIAGIWDTEQESGVISIIFGNLDISRGQYQFYGIHTVPVSRKRGSQRFITAFAQQDVVVGQGSDTLIHIGLNRIQFEKELERLNENQPNNAFTAARQNIWYVDFDQNDPTDVYDDNFEINGGGQIVSTTQNSGGIMYHALLETKYNYAQCNQNPLHGTGFIQNIKAGSTVDLGNISMDFHDNCNGKSKVTFATGEYLKTNGRELDLLFQ